MENKKKNLTLSEEIRFGRRTQGRFSVKPPVGPILHPINPPKYFSLFRRQENLGLENQKVCERLGYPCAPYKPVGIRGCCRIAASSIKSSTNPKMLRHF